MTERGAPHSLALMESGKLLPGVNVIIANADTKGQCGDSHLGEVCFLKIYIFILIYSNTTQGRITKIFEKFQ